MIIQSFGALVFGIVIGWFTYFVMRHSKDHAVSDLVALIAGLGGAAVVNVFPATSGLFAWYAIGLGVGAFAYFLVVWKSGKDPTAPPQAFLRFITGRD